MVQQNKVDTTNTAINLKKEAEQVIDEYYAIPISECINNMRTNN